MKTQQKSLFSLILGFVSLKSNNLVRATFLFAAVLGIFLLPKTALMASITPEKIISLTNAERNRSGLSALDVDDQLTQAARAKAQAILDSQTFDHTINGKKFSSWIKATGYQYNLVGENLAIDFVTSEGLLRAWMGSPAHRENILNHEYDDIGVGVAEGTFAGQKTIVVAQIFGDPMVKAAPIPENISRLNERIIPWTDSDPSPGNYLSLYRQTLGKLSLLTEKKVTLF
jgi:hypothetical protein